MPSAAWPWPSAGRRPAARRSGRNDPRVRLGPWAPRAQASSGCCIRARTAGLVDVGSVADVARQAEVIVSVCPPHAALEVARAVRGFTGLYVDANAIAPHTAAGVSAVVSEGGARYVDGG